MRYRLFIAAIAALSLLGEPVVASYTALQYRMTGPSVTTVDADDAYDGYDDYYGYDGYDVYDGYGGYGGSYGSDTDRYPIVLTPPFVNAPVVIPPLRARPVNPWPRRLYITPEGVFVVPDPNFFRVPPPGYPYFQTGGSAYFPTPEYPYPPNPYFYPLPRQHPPRHRPPHHRR